MFTNVAVEPEGLATMAAALEAYCQDKNLDEAVDREAVARRILGLFASGKQTEAALLETLEAGDRRASAA